MGRVGHSRTDVHDKAGARGDYGEGRLIVPVDIGITIIGRDGIGRIAT